MLADLNGFVIEPAADSNPIRFEIDTPLDDVSELTMKGSKVVPKKDSVGGRSNVIKVSGLEYSTDGIIGVKFGDGFEFAEEDVFTYSLDVYGEAGSQPDLWLRDHRDWNPMACFYKQISQEESNTWITLSGTATYDQLVEKSKNVGSDDTWNEAGDFAFYIRPRSGETPTFYIDNLKVTVTRKLDNQSTGILEKKFSALSGKQTFSFNVLIPEDGADGLEATFGGAKFTTNSGKFYINEQEVYTYTNNVWYKIEIQTDGTNANMLVNGVPQGPSVLASGTRDSIKFKNGSTKEITIDDICVHKTFDKSEYDESVGEYPEEPTIVSTGKNLGMVSYPMWREGIQYGWDFISSFENRTPALGYYTGGSQEVADWNNKWMLEHGIDHVIYPMPRNNSMGAVKAPIRGEELHDGFMTSEFRKTATKDGLGFAFMLSQPTAAKYEGAAEFNKTLYRT